MVTFLALPISQLLVHMNPDTPSLEFCYPWEIPLNVIPFFPLDPIIGDQFSASSRRTSICERNKVREISKTLIASI